MTRRKFISDLAIAGVAASSALGSPVRSVIGASRSLRASDANPLSNPYVTEGLVAMWDGIWNTGEIGVHNSEATNWIDLVSGENSECINPRWNEDSFHMTRYAYHSGDQNTSAILFSREASAAILSRAYSFQMVTKNNGSTSSFHQIFGFKDETTIFILRQNEWLRRFYSDANGYVWSIGGNNYAGTVTIEKNENVYHRFINSNNSSSGSLSAGSYTPEGDVSIYIGGLPNVGSNMVIDVCCVRIYNRPLSTEEVSYNHAIDKERFGLP